MSNFNEYNIRQVGERIRLPGISVSISEKKKEDSTLVRWAQLSKFNPKTEKYENFSIFKDGLEMLDSRFRDRMQSILILEVKAITKDKWGFYNFLPQSYFFDVSQVLDLYDTSEELDPLT